MNRLSRLWPLPAVLAWLTAWAVFTALLRGGWSPQLALGAAVALGVAASLLGANWWRRLIIGLGFPLQLLISGAVAPPAWAWLLPLFLLLLIYPLNAWRDAPLFPTPPQALRALASHAPLPAGARLLDAGCGLGDGLIALRRAYPAAQFDGVEWSWLLRSLCALRCSWARVRQGDIWLADWSGYDLVYLFQRPESMARAVAKAEAELRPGAWLVSLAFEATAWQAKERLQAPDGRPLWLYQAPFMQADSSLLAGKSRQAPAASSDQRSSALKPNQPLPPAE
jgi:SAM-dependent methyltransferase